MGDLHLKQLGEVPIVDDENAHSVLAMLHHFREDNQDVLLDAGLSGRLKLRRVTCRRSACVGSSGIQTSGRKTLS
jgi:hypothetical protein